MVTKKYLWEETQLKTAQLLALFHKILEQIILLTI